MRFRFVPMNAEYVQAIVGGWHYDGEYRFYDYARSRFLRDPKNWEDGLFAVLDEDGNLVGEFTIWFEDGRMWIGFGLEPGLTGRGLGQGFVAAGIRFGVEHYGYAGSEVMLAVAAFNRRAITVYERLGFREAGRYTTDIDGRDYEFVTMRLEL